MVLRDEKTAVSVPEPPINRLIMNGIPEQPSELNTWIHLSSTRESGRNYPLEVAAKLGDLDHNLRQGNFSIVHLIQYLTDEPLESIYDPHDDLEDNQIGSLVYIQSKADSGIEAVYFLEFDTVMNNHPELVVLKHTPVTEDMFEAIETFIDYCKRNWFIFFFITY